MALQTLKNTTNIGGFPVRTEQDIKEIFHNSNRRVLEAPNWEEWRSKHPIIVDHEQNTISFKIQNGPVKESGVNGCQVDTIIEAAKKILEGLNEQFPSEYNTKALSGLQYAIDSLKLRTEDREARGVEGTSQA